MRKLLKNLFSLWLTAALTVSPLQAFGALSGSADAADTLMQSHADAHQGGGVHAPQHCAEQSHCPDCAHCEQHGCSGDDCSASSCSGLQLQPGAISGLSLASSPRTMARIGTPVTGVVSRSDPPLLRPPV